MAKSPLADSLEKHLECAVCLEQYNEPKVLPCHHTFCKTCLEGLLTKQGDMWNVMCPTCRANAEVPSGMIDSLPVNFFVNNLLSDVSLHGDSGAGNLEYNTKTHHLTFIEEAKKPASSATNPSLLCKKHEGELLKVFCETCDETVCRDCTIIEHRDHKYTLVKDAYLKVKGNVWKILEDTKTKVGILEGALKAVLDMKELVQSRAEKTEEKVHEYFNKLLATVEVRHQELISEIKGAEEVKMKKLQSQQEDLEMALGSAKSSVEFTEKTFESDSHVEALNMKKQVIVQLQEVNLKQWQLELLADETLDFKADDKCQEAISVVGQISDVTTCASTSVVTMGHGSEGVMYNPFCGQPLEFTVIAKERSRRKRVEGGDICEVEIQGPGDSRAVPVDVRDCEDGTYSFNYTPTREGRYLMTVKLNGSTVQGSPFTWNAEKWNLVQLRPTGDVHLTLSNTGKLTAQKVMACHGYVDGYYYGRSGYHPQVYSSTISGSMGFNVGQHSWQVQISSSNWQSFGLGCCGFQLNTQLHNCQTGNQWTWFSGSWKYQPLSGVQQSLITGCQNNDVIEVYLNCDNNKLLMYNQRTKQSDTWEGVQGEVFPVFHLFNHGDMVSL